MVTLRDFIELDCCICGLDIDIRYGGTKLKEIHRFGVGAWPGNQRDYIRENVYREFSYPNEVLIYLHPEPINFHQTTDKYKGVCRPWGVLTKKIPKKYLDSQVASMQPFTAGFLDKHNNGHYYSINLVAEGETGSDKPYETPIIEKIKEPDNLTFDELFNEIEE